MILAPDLVARPDTIGRSILEAARNWPDRQAFIFGDRHADHAEIARQTVSCARNLMALGVVRGEHVGILMPNCWDYAILVGALELIGACAVVLNSRYRGEELEYVIRHAEITVLFVSDAGPNHPDLRGLLVSRFPELAQWRKNEALRIAGAPRLRQVFRFNAPDERSWPTEADFEAGGPRTSPEALAERVAAIEPDDIALIIFSSGTTAQPKACMISHRSVMQVSHGVAERMELTADDVFWNPLPFYHLSSHLPLGACRQVGAAFVSQGHFAPAAALAELEKTGATVCYPAFPALTAALVDHPDFSKRDLSALRIQVTIGAPGLLRKFADAMPHARQVCCYGLTECGGLATMSSPGDTFEQRIATVGKPLPGFSIRIVDPETLEDVPPGERGEILIKGPIFSGYFRDEEQTAKVLVQGGWLRSGDAGWIDGNGLLAYADRLKDMLKIGGENVAAAEVESFLARHPKIRMVQVIGAPDDRLAEVVAAYVELNSGESMSRNEVIEYCAGGIASYKIPRYVRFVTEWPMSATKIQKFRLARNFAQDEKIDVAAFLNRPGPAGSPGD